MVTVSEQGSEAVNVVIFNRQHAILTSRRSKNDNDQDLTLLGRVGAIAHN
jgi:hypothetical protein